MSEDHGCCSPTESEWGFKNLEDDERTRKLEAAPAYDEIVRKVRQAFRVRILERSARGYDLAPFDPDPRAIIQFQVDPDLYDEFFNSRTGYRAQYWQSVGRGVDANAFLVVNLLAEICDLDPWPTGWSLKRDFAMRSLLCAGAKVWISEKFVGHTDTLVRIYNSPKLAVPQWRPEEEQPPGRARAARLPPNLCWLDLKGCFLDGESIRRPKDPFDRAGKICTTGWT
jgi:hypothetical protein